MKERKVRMQRGLGVRNSVGFPVIGFSIAFTKAWPCGRPSFNYFMSI